MPLEKAGGAAALPPCPDDDAAEPVRACDPAAELAGAACVDGLAARWCHDSAGLCRGPRLRALDDPADVILAAAASTRSGMLAAGGAGRFHPVLRFSVRQTANVQPLSHEPRRRSGQLHHHGPENATRVNHPAPGRRALCGGRALLVMKAG